MIYGVIYTIFNAAMGFISLFIISSFSSVDVYGEMVLIKASSGVFVGMIALGISDTAIRFMNELTIDGNRKYLKSLIAKLMLIDLVVALFVITLINLSEGFLQSVYFNNKLEENIYTLYSIGIFFLCLRPTLIGVIQFQNKFKLFYCLLIIEALLIIFLLVYFGKRGSFGLREAVLSYVIPYIFVTLFFYIPIIYYIFSIGPSRKLNASYQKEAIKFSFKNFAASSLKSLNQRIDLLLIGLIFNKNDVALYDAIKKVINLGKTLVQPLITISNRKLVKILVEKNKNKAKLFIKNQGKIIILTGSVISVIAIFTIDILFSNLFGIFTDQINFILKILCFILSVSLLITWWAKSYSSGTNPRYSIEANFIYLIFSTPLIYYAGSAFHINGVIASISLINIIIYFYWRHRLVEK